MNACMQGSPAVLNQMLRLAVPDPESWRGLHGTYTV